MSKKIIFTTSWDDGHILDKRVMGLLNRYNMKGTFYITVNGKNRLTDDDLKIISKMHEIGAHTLNHPYLTKIKENEALEQIKQSKIYLENIIDKPVKMFAYPSGDYNDSVKNLVKLSDFIGARTTQDWTFNADADNYEMPATIHIYPHPVRRSIKNWKGAIRPVINNMPGIIKYHLPFSAFFSWTNLAKALFDYVCKNGGIYHLWGHSWEIEQYDMWEDFEEFLKYVHNQNGVKYLTNGEIIEFKNNPYAFEHNT